MNTDNLIFKPMLAYSLNTEHLEKIKYPVIVQPKIDGIRCCILGGNILSRKLKLIPNDHVRKQLSCYWQSVGEPYLLDGELTLKGYPSLSFQAIQSAIMSKEGKPNFRFTIFDRADYKEMLRCSYADRLHNIMYDKIESHTVFCLEHLLSREENYLKNIPPYEGIIIRSLKESYKFGRSTFKEQGLMKYKRFSDGEAVIKGFECQYRNDNDEEENELGETKRSSHQANMIPLDTLGVLIVEAINGEYKGMTLRIGTGKGLDYMLRKQIWNNRGFYLGKLIEFQYQKIGSKDMPRIITMKGLRIE